ncbi:MAG: 30S ribosomal protein S13 [Candidatus Nanoarchaeia archaeon]
MAKQEKKSAELIRIMSKDILANNSILFGLANIKGMSVMFSNAVCVTLGLDKNRKIGTLSESEIEAIEDYLSKGEFTGIPTWMKNQQKDTLTGENRHFVGKDLDFQNLQLQRRNSKIRSYKVLRSKLKLTVRGQRTASNFRRQRMLNSKKSKTRGNN